MFTIYELTPAPWGDQYRFVESFDTSADAAKVLKVLESVNINFKVYKIVNWAEPEITGCVCFGDGSARTGSTAKTIIKEVNKEDKLASMSESEWNLLKATGLLWEIYPGAPSTYKELQDKLWDEGEV